MRVALLGTFTGVIERAGGRFTADHWGMRDLAHPVRKQMRGYFVRLEYVAPATPWPNSNHPYQRRRRVQVPYRKAGRRGRGGCITWPSRKVCSSSQVLPLLRRRGSACWITSAPTCARLYHGTRQDQPYRHLRQAPAPALHRDQARPSDGSAVLHRRPFL